jgi:hypothetical protein
MRYRGRKEVKRYLMSVWKMEEQGKWGENAQTNTLRSH